MRYRRPSTERGKADFGWLRSFHTFSFGRYYDPEHMGMSVLRVINDDTVAPGRGFDTHGHQDMEIVSYVVDGALVHKDSTGNVHTIPAGDVQRMSAGKGIMHSEYNASSTQVAKFLQIWILPSETGIDPAYEQKTIPQTDDMTPLVTPSGVNGSVRIHQDVSIYRVLLDNGKPVTFSTGHRMGYLHLIHGTLQDDMISLSGGDGLGLYQQDTLTLRAQGSVEALWFDLPVI
ncbi:pirin family protein [Aestuariibacter sp. A3R04]|uniref:pirin family protein n=1 Tax=Aestuariibacter sp. A3R04 TaxID=2841571 RepID=UPI001C095F8D|nr:pirin family protein [Aestuariibacter sp. A3R04]MBU3022832.1 pirin family protein [Aestuariibacter sp. A3R04]